MECGILLKVIQCIIMQIQENEQMCLYGSNHKYMKIIILPPQDNEEHNADSYKHQYDHNHSNSYQQANVSKWSASRIRRWPGSRVSVWYGSRVSGCSSCRVSAQPYQMH